MALDGLTARKNDAGSIELQDKTGLAVAYIPAGFMSDSKFDRSRGEMTTSTAVTYELITLDGGPALKVTADRKWLDDPARVYPVRVDPTTTEALTDDDVYVDNDTGTGPGAENGSDLSVGTFDDGAHLARTFLKFDNWGLTGRKIVSARLRLFLSWTYDCNTNWNVDIYSVTQPWTAAGLVGAGLYGPGVGSFLGSMWPDDNYPACQNNSGDRYVGDWMEGYLDPATFNTWSQTPSSNMGLAVINSHESGFNSKFGWKKFTSRDFGGGYNAPRMVFDWLDVKPQINSQYPPSGYVAPTLTPELFADGVDPDGFPHPITYRFSVSDENGEIASNDSSSRTWKVPPGVLQWGKSYMWTVAASDGPSPTCLLYTSPSPRDS